MPRPASGRPGTPSRAPCGPARPGLRPRARARRRVSRARDSGGGGRSRGGQPRSGIAASSTSSSDRGHALPRRASPRASACRARRESAARPRWRRARTAARSRTARGRGPRGRRRSGSRQESYPRIRPNRILRRGRTVRRILAYMAVATAPRPTVRAVLGTPAVARLFATSILARIPLAAIGIVAILRTRELTGSPLRGGRHGGGGLRRAPHRGRPAAAGATRRPGRPCACVMLPGAATAAAALIAFALLPSGVALGWVARLHAGRGPRDPAAPRRPALTLLPGVMGDPQRLRAAYALELSALDINLPSSDRSRSPARSPPGPRGRWPRRSRARRCCSPAR